MRRIIITDLTRFSNRSILCTAGIDLSNGDCIRPMPYLDANRCKELNMLPGAILEGDFSPVADIEAPHIEDMNHQNLQYHGQCSADEFKEILTNSVYRSVEEGFEVTLEQRQKNIPPESAPARSLITLAINPQSIQIVADRYNPEKIKAHISDTLGKEYSFLSITDLGFHTYAENHYQQAGSYSELNALIQNQDEVFVRLGLSRYFQAPNGRAGFWIQVNGIYSFPEYFETARHYE